jgi:acyl dehydratase
MQAGPIGQAVDKRWLMAYHAALGERDERGHPVFPVSYEWPVTQAIRQASGLQELNAQLVHAQHDLVVHRAPVAEALTTRAQVVSAKQRAPGAFVVIRITTTDAAGKPVTTSDYGMLYRGVELEGAEKSLAALDEPPAASGHLENAGAIAVAATAAHVYTECARIWNPIHTDPAYAHAAGLPGIILHGTATLAYSVSLLLKKFAVDPGAVRRLQCRFSGMVFMPSTIAVRFSRAGKSIHFEARVSEQTVISRGRLLLE